MSEDYPEEILSSDDKIREYDIINVDNKSYTEDYEEASEIANKILQGDCLELMKDLEDKSVDMILCDLPYGVTQNKWDSIIPLDSLWEQYCRIIKEI